MDFLALILRLLEHVKGFLIKEARMAECLLNIAMKNVNTDHLTATPDDVADKKTFLGNGNSDKQEGRIPRMGKPTIKLPLNGSYTLPEGVYEYGEVSQDIREMQGARVNAGGVPVVIPTKNTYLRDDIIINPIPELKPSVIKKGEYVGGIGPGTWEGYVVTDPATIYYYGAYGPLHTIYDFMLSDLDSKLMRTDFKDRIEFYGRYGTGTGSWLEITGNVDITTKNKLVIEIMNHGLEKSDDAQYIIYLSRNTYSSNADMKKDYILSEAMSFGKSSNDVKTTFEIDVSRYDRSVYLMIWLNLRLKKRTNLYSIKFI